MLCQDDYVFDGDEGCCPKKEFIEADPETYDPEENYVVHPKCTPILIVE